MANPLVSTLLVWDADINPEGFAEKFVRRVGKIEYSATAAQFLYATSGTQKAFGSATRTDDLFMFAWQGGLKYFVDGTTNFFQVNPTIYHYYSKDFHKIPTAFRGNFTASNSGAISDLFVIDLPIEYDWVSSGVPLRVFGDFAVNLDGKQRALGYGRPDLDGENKAWQLGFQYGKAVNKGEWDATIAYQSTGAFAVDPNLVDSDIFDSRTNMQGLVLSGDYAFGAATQLRVTFASGKRKNNTIPALGSGDLSSNNALDKFTLIMTDLNLKF
jgi:hypothetical protein